MRDGQAGDGRTGPPNKGMKLTKLSAAPTLAPQAALGRRCRLMPAPSRMDAGTASQPIPGVRRTSEMRGERTPAPAVIGGVSLTPPSRRQAPAWW